METLIEVKNLVKKYGNHTAVDGILSADKIQNENRSFMVEENGNITAGKVKVYATTGEVTGLSNTTWDGTTNNVTRAATEGQLQDAVEDIETNSYKGWTVSANGKADNKAEVASKGNVDFSNNDKNIIVGQDGTNLTFDLNDNITLGDESGTRIQLNGNPQENSMISITNKDSDTVFNVAKDGTVHSDGDIVAKADSNKKYSLSEVGENAVRYNENKSTVALAGTNGTTITNVADGDVSEGSKEAVNGSQLYATNQKVDAGWVATDGANKVNVNPDNNTLKFTGDDKNNITVTAATDEDTKENSIKVELSDNLNVANVNASGDVTTPSADGTKNYSLKNIGKNTEAIYGTKVNGEYVTTVTGTLAATTIQNTSAKFRVDESGNVAAGKVIINATGDISGLSNTTWNGTTNNPSRAATEGQLQQAAAASKTTLSDGINTTVTSKTDTTDGHVDYQVNLNDNVYLGGNRTAQNSNIKLDGEKGNIQVGSNIALLGEDGRAIIGGVDISTTFDDIGKKSATITGLSNTTWDADKVVIDRAATEGQLQQAVNEVAEVANAGWNAKAGGNTINVKPNETLNFEGDGNITVSATSGTSSELKFGLNHNITLDNVKDKNTMLVINTDGREGYIPDNYKDSNEDAEDFIGKHGGFAIYYANPSLTTGDMTGTFGVTTDGVVHAKDVISYYSASSGSQSDVIRYSLNDVGDIVTQISHAVFDEGVGKTGMEYTLISDFEDEADKDSPFDAKEGKTRTIGLAVRQDGAVIVGAVVNDEGISRDRGIRINAETKTTYDKNGNEVTNNIATITGLENTEWKPPTPVATFAANDGSATVTSRAATESQLNDLYSAVAAYDVNVDGTIDYSHIALAGTPYGASRSGNGTHTGGTSITNVAYASGNDGSEAVNVDYLNDAINNAVKDGGAISDSDRHLQEGTYHVNDQGKVELIVADEKGENQSTVTIDNIANKNDITNLDNKIDNTFNDLNDKINNIDNVETDVKGGNINEDGTISLKTENEDGTTTNVTLKGQLTDSGVVQEGTSFDKETGTITITSQDKYSGKTSSVKVEGIASTEVVGATTKEDLADAYKDADKDGNATTAYITDSESMVEADVALDHAIQDVAGTSYANDMVLSNRIDSVEKRLGNVEERIDKVGAMAAAIANLRTMGFDPEAPTEIAIGVGQYKSETGIAIGVFHYPNQDFMLSASLSSSGDELMGGIGATWKLGRKSAAERAKDEEARHLEQAEEMKKLAQQEKVKAQAQRHAKLLAERQQASQKNA